MTSWPSLMSTSRSVIFERAKFNKRIQLHGKTLEQYITTVYHLAYTCNFGNLNENLIRDRLIVGIRDQSLSQQLQMDPNLTLEKAKKRIRQKEVVRQQSDIFKGKADKPVSDLEGVRYKHKFAKKRGDQPPVIHKKCTHCGKVQHPQDEYPAKDATCSKCRKRGHYSNMCLSKKSIADSAQGTDPTTVSDSDDNFLGAVGSKQKTQWLTEVNMNDVMVTFKIDTGAEVSAISETTLKRL